jgi:RHS repeat-associated protein
LRTDVGTITQTDLGYTGQRNLDAQGASFSLGLLDYRARMYSSYITHFNQPDPIVPDPYNPQSFNRYAYALNNPLRYNDPSGHETCRDDYYWDGHCHSESAFISKSLKEDYKWNLLGTWTLEEMRAIIQAAYDIQLYINSVIGIGLDWMNKYLGGVNITHVDQNSSRYAPRDRDSALPALLSGTGAQTVFLRQDWLTYNGVGQGPRWLTHELGHVWDMHTGVLFTGGIYGGVADQMNGAMGGNIMSNPFACRYCGGSGAGNNDPFMGKGGYSYGNNSSADYLAEVFALSVYPDSTDPVPGAAQIWMVSKIQSEGIGLVFPIGYNYSIDH